jgi:hypothetical protein
LTWRGLNSNPGLFRFIFLLSLFYLENRVCLSRGVQVAGVAWRASMRIVAGVGDLVQRTRDGRTGQVLGGRAIERYGGAVCGLHRARGDEVCQRWLSLKTKVDDLSAVWPQNLWDDFLSVWASKLMATVCEWFGLKATWTVFAGLAS